MYTASDGDVYLLTHDQDTDYFLLNSVNSADDSFIWQSASTHTVQSVSFAQYAHS